MCYIFRYWPLASNRAVIGCVSHSKQTIELVSYLVLYIQVLGKKKWYTDHAIAMSFKPSHSAIQLSSHSEVYPRDNIHEINRKGPIQTQCVARLCRTFMINILQAVLTWGMTHSLQKWTRTWSARPRSRNNIAQPVYKWLARIVAVGGSLTPGAAATFTPCLEINLSIKEHALIIKCLPVYIGNLPRGVTHILTHLQRDAG